MGSYYKQQLNDWVASLDVKADLVYDVGGAQHPIQGRTRTWEVKDYKIIDLAVPHVELQHPDIEWDMNRPMEGLDIPQGDLLFCLGVFDYIIEPGIAMRNVKRLMKKDGLAWVEFPFIYPVHQPVEEEGCRYSEGCIRRLSADAGLHIEEIIYKRPKPGNTLLVDFYREDGMRAARGVDHNVTGYIVRMRK